MKQIMLLLPFSLLLCASAQSPEPTLAIPPQEKELLCTWIGFDAEAVVFCRLVIKEKGGIFAYSVPGYPVRAYDVVSWSLKRGRICLDVKNSSEASERIHIYGDATTYRFDLTLEGADRSGGTWARKIAFFREARVEARVKELERSMNAYSADKRLRRPR
jgi:hypothetical protein